MDIIVCIGDENGPTTGTPVYPDDDSKRKDEPIWRVYEVTTDPDDGEWEYLPLTDDLTMEAALDVAGEQYPHARLMG